MKTTLSIFIGILLSLTFTSCEKDLLDVDFNTTIKEIIVANIDEGQQTIDHKVLLSLENEDTKDYLDKLKEVKINKLTYQIVSFSGNEDATVDIEFTAANTPLRKDAFVVSEAFNEGTVFEITDLDKLSSIADVLKENKKLETGFSGESVSNGEGVKFEIEVIAELEIIASPLEK
ncbi:hypothetical protein [Brumimicrobium oceani]|uniref:Uncharacterized protein n=1 Tax=Brumimicrobium oceani TaxID=2100725 RepID=A0A2U2XAV4_9FLAO|nr:hypothetical protein [Brumimicrobium oceani]PWH84893.1 hypothetical protein DIT68_12175 [Brumimicrobium oceani]